MLTTKFCLFLPGVCQVSFHPQSPLTYLVMFLFEESPKDFLLFISSLFCSTMLFIYREGKNKCMLRQHFLAMQQAVYDSHFLLF